MPFKSKAQRRKFWAMEDRGEISKETVNTWERETKQALPERVMEKESTSKIAGLPKSLLEPLAGAFGGSIAGTLIGAPVGAVTGAINADPGQGGAGALRGAGYGALGGAALGGVVGGVRGPALTRRAIEMSGTPTPTMLEYLEARTLADKLLGNTTPYVGGVGGALLAGSPESDSRDRDADNDGISSEGTPREKEGTYKLSFAGALGAQAALEKLGAKISPELLRILAGTTVGTGAGALSDTEDPAMGALQGGIVGTLLGPYATAASSGLGATSGALGGAAGAGEGHRGEGALRGAAKGIGAPISTVEGALTGGGAGVLAGAPIGALLTAVLGKQGLLKNRLMWGAGTGALLGGTAGAGLGGLYGQLVSPYMAGKDRGNEVKERAAEQE